MNHSHSEFEEFKKDIHQAIGRVKHDTGNIRLGLESVDKHLSKLSNRTKDLEHKVSNLEDDTIRQARCPNKDVLEMLVENMITAKAIQAQMDAQEQRQIQHETARDGRMRWVVGSIGVIFTIITIVVNLAIFLIQSK